MHDGEPLVEGTLRVWPQIGRATGAQAISLRIMEFGTGMSPTIQNGNCDQVLYVIHRDREAVEENSQGKARSAPPVEQNSLESDYPEGVQETSRATEIILNHNRFLIANGTGIYIRPNQTFAINNFSGHVLSIVSSQCPDPDREIHFAVLSRIDAKPSAINPPPIVRLADQKAQPTADRWYRVLIDERAGSAQVTQFVGSIPSGRAPDHFHNYEEVLFILQGEGRMWAGETNTPIGVGSCIYLPKGQVHCVENTGDGELRLLGVFYPAGSPSVRYEV
jgi:mannose-6-phosphate isomerase-like protein (cupin superfamily)